MVVRGITCKAAKGIFSLSRVRRIRSVTYCRDTVQKSGTNSISMAQSIFIQFAHLLREETKGV